MDYEETILTCLDNNDKEAISNYLSEKRENPLDVKIFIKKLNDIIIIKNDFELIQNVLLHDSFENIYSEFKESDVLIRACEEQNEEALKWLLTMDINPFVKDNNGMTALMHASKSPKILFVVEWFIYNHNECINIEDNNGETALFYASNNIEAFTALVNAGIDLNHLNKNGDSILLYCCKNDIPEPIRILSYSPNIDINIIDKNEYNAAMYLIKNGRYHEFQLLTGGNIDLDFKNKNGETLLSILIQCIYKPEEKLEKNYIIPYIKILMILVQMECNFNITIDDKGNTPLMFFIMIEDIYTVHYILMFCRNIDVSLKNKKGETAFSLSLKLQNKSLIEILMNHKSFDYDYRDENNNTLLMLYLISNDANKIKSIINRNDKLLNEVNNKKENALIIATKIQSDIAVKVLLEYNANINQQDYLGNTALHYAIENNFQFIINALVYSGADINLKNKQGKSALEYAKEIGNETILNILNEPTSISLKVKTKKKSLTKGFSLKKIKKLGSRKSVSSKSENEITRKSSNSEKDKKHEYIDVPQYKDIIDFSINNDQNTYIPLSNINNINEIEMETYGYKDIIQPETGVKKTVIRQAFALEAIIVLLEITGNIF